MQSKYKRLIKDMGIFALGALGSKLVLFLLLPIYTHVLSDSEYGIADLVFTVGDLLLPFISLAIFNGLLRYGLIKGKRDTSLLSATIIFLVGSTVTILVTPLVGLYKPVSVWKWYLSANVIMHFARSNTLVYLKVKDRNKLYSLLSIVQALLLVACNVLLLIVFKLGVQGYLLSTIISNALVSLLAFGLGGMPTDLKNASLDKPLMREMVIYSLPFIFNDVSWWIIHSSDKIMIEWMVGSAMLGLYTAAAKIPSLINALTMIFSQAWSLAAIKEYDTTKDTKFYSNVLLYFSIVIFGIIYLVIYIVKPFMYFYVSAAFRESWHYVPLLIVSAAFAAISTFAGGLFSALKQSKSIMTSTLIAGGVNIVVNYLLIQIIGVYGAVIGTLVAYFLVAFVRFYVLRKHINMNFHFGKITILGLLAIVQAALVGLDIQIVGVSVVTIVVYLLIAKNDFIPIFNMIRKRFNK